MSLLKPLGQGQGYLKAGFLGFPKAGKTFTATELAIGTRAFLGATGPIAMFDTEGGSEYIAQRIREATGQELLGLKSHSLGDLIAMARECEREGVSVLIVDSVTHVWRELCDSYLDEINARLKKKGRAPRYRLEFQDWGPIKRKWAEWTDVYLNSKLHVIICGRAGYEYDKEEDEDGKKELVKTGVKMKTESEFGFEPSLLVEMEQLQNLKGKVTQIVHRATVIGDRFSVINGMYCDEPTFEFFKPFVERLKPGAHQAIATKTTTMRGELDDNGDDDWQWKRKQREIALDEIECELLRAWPSTSAKEKQAKMETLEKAFATRSWKRIEVYDPETLKVGLATIRDIVAAELASREAAQ